MSAFLSLLKNRNFRNLWFGQITSQVAVNMFALVLILQIYQSTHSNTAVSAISLAIGLPAIFVGVVAGGIVDSFDKRLVLIFSNFFRVLIFGVFFLLFPLPIVSIYILTCLFTVASQFFIPAEAPSIPYFVKKEELLPANSLFTFSLYVATVVGFIMSGPILLHLGPQIVYVFMAALMILAMVFALLLPPIKAKNMPPFSLSGSLFYKDIKEGLSFIMGNVRIQQSLLLMTFAQALLATLATLAPGFADKTLHIVLENVSLIVMGPAALGLIVGALWVGTFGKRYLKKTLVLVGIMGTGTTLVLLSIMVRVSGTEQFQYRLGDLPFGGVEISMFILFVLGFTNAFISVPAAVVVQEATEGRLRGRVYGVLTSLTGGAAILPVMFSGILADTIGITRTLSLLGIGVLLFGAYRVFILKQSERNDKIAS